MTAEERQELIVRIARLNEAGSHSDAAFARDDIMSFVEAFAEQRDRLKDAGCRLLHVVESYHTPDRNQGMNEYASRAEQDMRRAVAATEVRQMPEHRTLMDVFAGTGLDVALNQAFQTMEPFREAMDMRRLRMDDMSQQVCSSMQVPRAVFMGTNSISDTNPHMAAMHAIRDELAATAPQLGDRIAAIVQCVHRGGRAVTRRRIQNLPNGGEL